MNLLNLILISAFIYISHVRSIKLSDSLKRNSIKDEITFHLIQNENPNDSQELFIGNRSSVLRSSFNRNLSTKVIIHGWTHGQESHWLTEMKEVMAATRKWNVIVVGWAPMSHALYSEAKEHSRVVGQQLAKFCVFLIKLGRTRPRSLHFIGHSMGAHIAGYASQRIKRKVDEVVYRISGLDPVAFLFERPQLEAPNNRLDADDAFFVDVIHTNGRGLGMMTAIGDVDFYPNGGMQQPGCGSWMCSHERSCEFWTASVKNPCEYRAVSYQSWTDYLAGKKKNLLKVSMGINAKASTPSGLYFLETSLANPYVNTKSNDLDFI